MGTFQDDDLDLLPQPAAKVQSSAKTTAIPDSDAIENKTAAPATASDNLDVDFGDEKITSFSDGLDKVNPEKGKSIRCALATDILKSKAAYTHYIEHGEKKGNYRCLRSLNTPPTGNEICCSKLGDNYVYVVVPVVVYTNADAKGALPEGPIEWKIGFIRIGRSLYRTIGELPAAITAEEDNKTQLKPEDLDLKLTRLTNGKWDVKALSKKARWRKNPQFVSEVKAAFAPFLDGRKLESKLGRRLTVLEYKALIASLAGGRAEDTDMSNIDDL